MPQQLWSGLLIVTHEVLGGRDLAELDLGDSLQFGDPNHEKVTTINPKRVPGGSPNPPKICKNPGLAPKVSCGVSLGTPGSPKWCPKVPKWSLQASQIAGLGTKNHPIQHSANIASPANTASHRSTGYQRGRRQGAKPLR